MTEPNCTPITAAAEIHKMSTRIEYLSDALHARCLGLWNSEQEKAMGEAFEALRKAEASLVKYAAENSQDILGNWERSLP